MQPLCDGGVERVVLIVVGTTRGFRVRVDGLWCVVVTGVGEVCDAEHHIRYPAQGWSSDWDTRVDAAARRVASGVAGGGEPGDVVSALVEMRAVSESVANSFPPAAFVDVSLRVRTGLLQPRGDWSPTSVGIATNSTRVVLGILGTCTAAP